MCKNFSRVRTSCKTDLSVALVNAQDVESVQLVDDVPHLVNSRFECLGHITVLSDEEGPLGQLLVDVRHSLQVLVQLHERPVRKACSVLKTGKLISIINGGELTDLSERE
ncbi:hypothetical protein WR25_08159 [Diploscapter pachys]|uniref:Uncharacterized protein n=1 Tax=Diploscapter pachys TaxID=2018661 RepID=A0A2A2LTE3_9BILA|nr:hypothetical protein WR25_08159 [Diploscapter pachys]